MDVFIEILDNSSTSDILNVIHSRLPLDYYIPLISHTFSLRWVFVDNYNYRNNRLHSFNDKPAVVSTYGYKAWYRNGRRHRDNLLPAVIYSCGRRGYYRNGLRYIL